MDDTADTVKKVRTISVEETRALGARLARVSVTGDVYGLVGNLGTGKTEFVRGFVDALEPGLDVRSPSFSIVNCYETPAFPVYHFDFYRLNASAELNEIGFREYVAGSGVCIIEWAGMFPDQLPPETTRIITFADNMDGTRTIDITQTRLVDPESQLPHHGNKVHG